jgi:hypothetical protein
MSRRTRIEKSRQAMLIRMLRYASNPDPNLRHMQKHPIMNRQIDPIHPFPVEVHHGYNRKASTHEYN